MSKETKAMTEQDTQRYAVRVRDLYYRDHAGRPQGDERWQILEAWDEDDVVTSWPTREAAEAAIPSRVYRPHGGYSRQHEVVRVGSRDHRRAVRNSE